MDDPQEILAKVGEKCVAVDAWAEATGPMFPDDDGTEYVVRHFANVAILALLALAHLVADQHWQADYQRGLNTVILSVASMLKYQRDGATVEVFKLAFDKYAEQYHMDDPGLWARRGTDDMCDRLDRLWEALDV